LAIRCSTYHHEQEIVQIFIHMKLTVAVDCIALNY